MYRSTKALVSLVAAASLVLTPGAMAGGDRDRPDPQAGAVGAGDPYFPTDGNGGYDVRHYDLDLRYDPETDVLKGRAKISARATQDLRSFNLDLQGLEVESVRVDGRRATWERDGDELTVTPRKALRDKKRFTVVVRYTGIPERVGGDLLGDSGFILTDDGALAVGQPHSADTWYPVNDHPSDEASYDIAITVPKGLEAVSNGVLEDKDTRRGWTTWEWRAKEPMPSYLSMLAIGQFDLRKYRADGIRFWDAVDDDLAVTFGPRTGEQGALSQDLANNAYQRLGRTISVPAEGATLTFWVHRRVEFGWDFMLVEAAPAGTEDWTTLAPQEGHASQDTGFFCVNLVTIHPFLEHYLTPDIFTGDCLPTGTTGEWWAATGNSDGYEQWTIDLSAYAGTDVQVAISNVTDDLWAQEGLFVDDIEVSTGEGSTSFEEDGDVMDGWTVLGPPAGSPGNEVDWTVLRAGEYPPTIIDGALARQPEIIDFLEGIFGDYPFRASGGIVDDYPDLFYALETQTRPIYGLVFFSNKPDADAVIVHELAHQWTGDLLTVEQWQHIWLNEGFATYTEWLWSEREGLGTAQEIFESVTSLPAEETFWEVVIGDPGPDLMFDTAVYFRGAATLHALRLLVGDEAFFEILREWIDEFEGEHVTTDDFIALAEEISGQELDQFFQDWLFTGAKPPGLPEPLGLMSSESLEQLLPDLGGREESTLRH